MKHRPDCPWLTDLDAACTCATEAFLADCTPEEARMLETDNAYGQVRLVDVARRTWGAA